MRYFKLSSWLDFWPSQKFDFADITGWINFTGDWCQEATCYLCCESCICSWSSLPSLNKWSHWPLWCHHFLLTLLCNCWFISNSSDFSICPNWQAKRTEPFMHTQGGQEGSLVRKKERRAAWWDREWALALWLPLLSEQRASPHRLHLLHQSMREGKLAYNFDSIMSCFHFLCVWLQNILSDYICIALSWRFLSFII